MINGHRLRSVLAENRLLPGGPRFNGLLSYSSETLSGARAASVKEPIGVLIKAL